MLKVSTQLLYKAFILKITMPTFKTLIPYFLCRRWETRLANAQVVLAEGGSHQERAPGDVGETMHRNYE